MSAIRTPAFPLVKLRAAYRNRTDDLFITSSGVVQGASGGIVVADQACIACDSQGCEGPAERDGRSYAVGPPAVARPRRDGRL
jgi:hypothetical protein